jgi:hypothetical protein
MALVRFQSDSMVVVARSKARQRNSCKNVFDALIRTEDPRKEEGEEFAAVV